MFSAAIFNKVRPRWIALAVVAVAAVAAVAGTVTAVSLHRAPQAKAAPHPPRIGGHFELVTPDGSTVTEATFRGKWLLVYFGYTFCPDVCPGTLMSMTQALQNIGPLADKVQPIFITFDPARDTPQIMGEYVKNFDPRFVGLSGTPQQTAAAAKVFHVYNSAKRLDANSSEYVFDHSSYIYIMDPNGNFVNLLAGDMPGHEVAKNLKRVID
jgi:protein SCO1